MKLHVKYTETYPDTLPEFSFDMEEGELDEEDFDTIMQKVTEAVSAPSVHLSGHILEKIKLECWTTCRLRENGGVVGSCRTLHCKAFVSQPPSIKKDGAN